MMNDVRKALGERTMCIETPWVATHGKNSNPERYVHRQYYTVLRLDGKGAHYKGATQWNYVQTGKHPDPALFFAQTLMLLVEQKQEGSVRPKYKFSDGAEQWYKLCELGARIKVGPSTVDERKLFSQLTVCDGQVNLRFLRDLQVAEERLVITRAHLKKQKKKKTTKRKGRAADEVEEGDESIDLDELEAADEAPMPRPPEMPQLLDPVWVREGPVDRLCVDERSQRRKDFSKEESVGVDANSNMHKAAVAILRARRYHSEMQRYEENILQNLHNVLGKRPREEEEEEIPNLPSWPEWTESIELVGKIQMTLTAMPREGGNPQNPDDIIALLLRFLVRDPEINVGLFYQKIVANCVQRNRPKSNARGKYGNNQDEMFPSYVALFGTNHPAGNHTTNMEYFRAVMSYDPTIQDKACFANMDQNQMFQSMAYVSHSDPFHLNNVLRWESAERILEDCGVDSSYYVLPEEWYDAQEKIATYPPRLMTFKYVSDGVLWHNSKYVGIREQLFPYVSQDSDFLVQLISGADPRALLDDNGVGENLDIKKISSVMQDIQNMIANDWLVEREKVQDRRLINYRTNNEYIHRYAEMLLINSQIMKQYPQHYRRTWDEVEEIKMRHGQRDWMDWCDAELKKRIKECAVYNAIRRRASEACMKVHKSLWLVEGNIDEVPIPETIQTIQKYYRDNHRSKFPNLTRGYIMYDPNMGLFSNAMLRLNSMFASIGKIIHPIICILGIGLFSCYYQGRELKWNMLGHGWHATGKTKTALDTFKKFTAIPGTTVSYTTSTRAADNTQRHCYDTIILSDETMGYKVDPKEAEKHQDLVNKEKVKMVENQLGHSVFKNVTLEDQTNVRWADLVTTDHFVTMVEVTNKEVCAKDALASRYYRFTMPLPKIPIHQLRGNVPEHLEQEVATYLRVGQYLMCCAMKCATVGGILPEPDKELWADMSARVIDYLKARKAVSNDVGPRELDIMWPLVRQYIYMWAVHCAFDMPGAPNYGKKFEVDMIKEVEPYLYCTMEIFWFGWTALASQWVDDNRCKFIHAVEVITGFKQVRDSIPEENYAHTNYCVYEHDRNNVVKWKTRDIQGQDALAREKGDTKMVDITRVVIPGDLNSVAHLISASSGLSPTDCLGLMNELAQFMYKPPGGAYKEMPQGSAREWHKYTNTPGNPYAKKVDVQGTNTMHPDFCVVNPDRTQPRTEFDVQREPLDAAVPLVQVDAAKKCVYIVPNVAELFKTEIVIEALMHATMSSEFPVGKILLGIPTEDSTSMLRSLDFQQDTIDAMVADLDSNAGWEMNEETGELDWKKSHLIPERMRPLSRTLGLSFNRRVVISQSTRPFFEDCHMAPVEMGSGEWKRLASDSLDAVSDVRSSIVNFDYESALRQHMKAGYGFDQPVQTPTFILKRFKEASKALNIPYTCNKEFPFDILVESMENEDMWKSEGGETGQWKKLKTQMFDPLQSNKMPRNPETARRYREHLKKKTPVPPPPPPPPSRRRDRQEDAQIPKAGAHSKRHRPAPDALMNLENRLQEEGL